jgi:hypothetical protein
VKHFIAYLQNQAQFVGLFLYKELRQAAKLHMKNIFKKRIIYKVPQITKGMP